ncbi:hypothetical protein BDR26DRAFT_873443 [Obelidium mucronatum]|nr:hypothetical protein BDR26DRAFT_873443 [Obelidium mucronatum]
MIPARYPHSSLPLSSANSKRFSDPHGSSTLSSASPRNTFPRRTSSSVTTSPVLGGKTSNHSLQHISYSPKHKLKGMRRYSHAATSASILQHQESLQTTRQPKRTSFLLSLLGSSSNSESPTPSTPTSPALQPSDPTSQQQQQPSPLVSFISRAFGPRRNLQHHRRPASHMPSLSELQQQQQQQTQQNQRASMPHMSCRTTSISSINSQVPLQQPPQQQHPQGAATTRTTKETRTKLTQALKLFEMGATEAAFATFRVCLQETNGSDLFVEYCVAVCLVHGYGCSGTGQDYDDGLEILKRLRDGGSVLARTELALLEEEEV